MRIRSLNLVFVFVYLCPAWLLALDCNVNGVEDRDDVAAGQSEDCNGNGVPDECEFAPVRLGDNGENLELPRTPRAVATADLNGDDLPDVVVGNTQSGTNVSSLSVFLRAAEDGFETPVDYDAGSRLSAVQAVDVDGDADVDVAIVNSNGLVVFPNLGDGSLGTPSEFPLPPTSRTLCGADLNGDGAVDFATTSRGRDLLGWVLNRGDGSFGPPQSFVTVGQPIAVAAGDLDGDGDVDIGVVGEGSETVALFENSGSASFSPLLSFALGARGGGFALVDVDADGHLDLLVGSFSATLLWRGRGDGTFDDPLEFPLAADIVFATDLSGDGVLDLVLGNGGTRLAVLVQGRDGLFSPPQQFSFDYVSVAAVDVDDDGDQDLTYLDAAPDRLAFLHNGLERAVAVESTSYGVGALPHGVGSGDFDGDGVLDVITGNGDRRTHTVFLGNGDGTLQDGIQRPIESGLRAVVVDDFDGDGTPDVVFPTVPWLFVYLNTDGGAFTSFERQASGLTNGVARVLSADIDGDGATDLLLPQQLSFNDGGGNLENFVLLDIGQAFDVGDLDGDGDLDIVGARTGAGELMVIENLGGRKLAAPVTIPVLESPRRLVLDDLDRDGQLDVATATDDAIVVLRGAGGTFVDPVSFPLGGRTPTAMIKLDMDVDGFTDVLVTSENNHSLSLLRGRGDGTLAAPQQFSVSSGPRITASADLNADGAPDLLVAGRQGAELFVLVNKVSAPEAQPDFLDVVCTELDFEAVSSSAQGPFVERATRFLLPVSDDAAPPGPLFVNRSRFATDEEFLRQVFSDRFGNLSEADYVALVERRATREYFAGTVFQLRLEDASRAYGFDVVTEGVADELLSQGEVEEVFAKLSAVFSLTPLVYFPRTAEAREIAAGFRGAPFDIVLVDDEPPPPPPPVGTPTFELAMDPGAEVCGVFVVANAARGVREEHALKSRVRLRSGVIELPTVEDAVSAALFEEVFFGPSLERAEPAGDGAFRVTRIPGEITTYRFTYGQEFTLSDGRRLELELAAPLVYRARGEQPLQRRRGLPTEFFVALKGREALAGRLDGAPLVRYGSCDYTTLPRWGVAWELADGTRVRLEERFEEAEMIIDTAPAALVRAEVELAGTERVVTEYTELVYSALRHNTEVDYWVVLAPPVSVEGVGEVHAVELRAPQVKQREEAGASYLGAEFEELASVGVSSFHRELLPDFTFVRGDGDGDGELTVADAIVLLGHIFRRESLACRKSGDANDDGRVNLLDAIGVVSGLFARGELPGAPFPACGADPTPDDLSCNDSPGCRP